MNEHLTKSFFALSGSECQSISRVIKSISLKQKIHVVLLWRSEWESTRNSISFIHSAVSHSKKFVVASCINFLQSSSSLGCYALAVLCALSLEIFSIAAMALVLSKSPEIEEWELNSLILKFHSIFKSTV